MDTGTAIAATATPPEGYLGPSGLATSSPAPGSLGDVGASGQRVHLGAAPAAGSATTSDAIEAARVT